MTIRGTAFGTLRTASVLLMKQLKYAPTVHVWAAIGTGFRLLVVHVKKGEDEVSGSSAPAAKPNAKTAAASRRRPAKTKSGVSTTKRYTWKELMALSNRQLREWMALERKKATPEEKAAGVNRFTYVHKCLQPMWAQLKKRKGHFTLLQDGAKLHVSNYTKAWLRVNNVQIVERHPSN